MRLSKKQKNEILSLYSDEGIERGGFILEEGLVECENDASNKVENFRFSCDSIDKIDEMEEKVIALVHTHPNGTSAMSKQDFYAFINWPQFLHLIVGKNGISCYKVTEKETVIMEDIVYDED